MNIRILGCSGGIGVGLATTSMAIDHDILIDGGTGLGELTLDEMSAVRHIFLTHSHLDHIAGLPMLVDSIFERIHTPIVVHGRPETLAALREHVFNWVIWPDFSKLPNADRPVLRFEKILVRGSEHVAQQAHLEGRQRERRVPGECLLIRTEGIEAAVGSLGTVTPEIGGPGGSRVR